MRKVALPLFPQFGLEPNVYYIPPVHAPTPFLRQMFGPGVDEAIETYRSAADDPDLAGLLVPVRLQRAGHAALEEDGDTIIGLEETASGDRARAVPRARARARGRRPPLRRPADELPVRGREKKERERDFYESE